MTTQFLRSARLRVGATGTLEKEYVGFRVTFKIEKTLESNPNTSTISIYNLSPDSRARFEAKNAIVSLDVGYGSELEQIYLGRVAKAFTRKIGPDFVTEIESGDGERAFQAAKVDLAFPPGATAQEVLSKVADTFKGVDGGGVKSIKNFLLGQFKSFATGFVASGSSRDVLDSLTKTCGLEWSIQDGQIQILEKGKGTLETAFEVSPSSGLVGSPGKVKASSAEGPQGGVEFSMLLQPKLVPGRLVRLSSAGVSGVFRIAKVVHEGDNQGGTWLSKCEGYLQ